MDAAFGMWVSETGSLGFGVWGSGSKVQSQSLGVGIDLQSRRVSQKVGC